MNDISDHIARMRKLTGLILREGGSTVSVHSSHVERPEPLLSVAQTAKLLRRSRQFVYDHINQIPGVVRLPGANLLIGRDTGAGYEFGPPQTAAAFRNLALVPDDMAALDRVKRQQRKNRMKLGAGYTNLDLVFCQPTGFPLHSHNLTQRDFKATIDDVQKTDNTFPGICFHKLRHVARSLLELGGVSLKVAMERHGHTSESQSFHYTHTSPDQHQQAALRVQDLLQGAGG
ncbi:MAG TPA: tyrosine-type recombinase/integrase [Chloroflexota bacterium]|nr:tyrosine-type recombinase/integrase [Chloroflexota bacterium]